MEHLISENTSHIAGLCGVISYLLAYSLLQAGLIGGNGYLYALMNAAAAGLVMISLIHAYNLASLLIQISFVLISIGGIIRIAFLTRLARFNSEERSLYETQFPNLEPYLARKVLDAGTWVDIPAGAVIAREGETLDGLTFLSSGVTKIFVQNCFVGFRGAGTVIGELSFMDASAATATVQVDEHVQGFVISRAVLRKLQNRYPSIRLAVTSSFSANTRDTLRRRTEEIVIQSQAA